LASIDERCKHEDRRNRTFYANERKLRTIRRLGYIREEDEEVRRTPMQDRCYRVMCKYGFMLEDKCRLNRYTEIVTGLKGKREEADIEFEIRKAEKADLKDLDSQVKDLDFPPIECDTCRNVYYKDESSDRRSLRCPQCGYKYGATIHEFDMYERETGTGIVKTIINWKEFGPSPREAGVALTDFEITLAEQCISDPEVKFPGSRYLGKIQ